MKFSELDTQPKIALGASTISSICRLVLQLAPQEATEGLEPVSAAAAKYPEEPAKFAGRSQGLGQPLTYDLAGILGTPELG
jgi:hypothetical protein